MSSGREPARLPSLLVRPLLAAFATVCLSLASAAFAHATLVIGDLEFTPDPPVPGEEVSVRISLVDPLLVAVEKALVRVEFRAIDPEDPSVPASVTGTEAVEFLALPSVLGTDYLTEVADGVYEGAFAAPGAGRYTVSVRDTTFRNEEAIANVGVNVGVNVGANEGVGEGVGVNEGVGESATDGANVGPDGATSPARGPSGDASARANGVIAFVLPPTPIAPRSLGTWLIWILGIPLAGGLLVTFFALRRPAEQDPDTSSDDSSNQG